LSTPYLTTQNTGYLFHSISLFFSHYPGKLKIMVKQAPTKKSLLSFLIQALFCYLIIGNSLPVALAVNLSAGTVLLAVNLPELLAV